MESQIEVGGIAAPRSLVRSAEKTYTLKKQVRVGEEIIRATLLFCGVVSIFTTIGIVYVLGSQALLFFDSKAFLVARSPVVDEAQATTLEQPIDADDRVISIEFDGERVPYANQQFLQIGDEVVRVVDRGRTTITVQRGQDGTSASAHEAASPVYGMVEVQIAPLNDMTAEDTVIQLEPTFGREFQAGDIIMLDLEEMRVIEANPDSLTVERGYEGTTPAEHTAEGHTIQLAERVTLQKFLTTTNWQPQIGQYGIWALMTATLLTSAIALVVAIPLGLGAAIYLSEYAPSNIRDILKPILEVLAGIPTVVFGFFALTFVSPSLRGIFGPQVQFQNLLSAGIVLGVLLIPYISSFSEDALRAVPRALREASLGLGATKLETTVKVVLPAAISGIGASIILATSRAVGETMIVAIAAGSGPKFTFNLFDGAETMTGHIARISGGDLSYNSIDYNSIFSIGLTLFILTLVLNLISMYVTNRFREQY